MKRLIKIDKRLYTAYTWKRKMMQITNIKNEREIITTSLKDSKRIKRSTMNNYMPPNLIRDKMIYKGLSSQGYGFSSGHVWMWELDCEESWVPKKWCFWSMVLQKTLESPLDCKEIQPVHSEGDQSGDGLTLEGMMLKLKLQYFGYLMQRVDSLEKTLMLGGIGGRRRRGRQRMRWLDGITDSTRWTWVWVNSRSWWWTGRPGVLRFMGSQRVGHNWVTELNWTYRLGEKCIRR